MAVFKLLGITNGVLSDSHKWEYLLFMCASTNDEVHVVIWGGYTSRGNESPELPAFYSFDSHYRPELDRFSKEILHSTFANASEPEQGYRYWPEIFPKDSRYSTYEPLHLWTLSSTMDQSSLLEMVSTRIQSRSERSMEHWLSSSKMFSAIEIVTKGWLGKGWRRTWLLTLEQHSGEILLVAEGGFSADGQIVPDLESYYPLWRSSDYQKDFHDNLDEILADLGGTANR